MTTGAELVTAIRRRAHQLGLPVSTFAAPLSPNTMAWLRQTERAESPKPHTIERVKALIEGRPVPPPPVNNFQKSPYKHNQITASSLRDRGPALDQCPSPVDRDPCFLCGTRRDIGCRHRRTAA